MLRELKEKVDPQHAALVVIDMQNDFCHDEGAKAQDGANVSLVQAIVPALQALVDGAHAAGVPVLFTQAVHNKWTDSEVRMERHLDASPNCMESTWGAEFYGIIPDERDLVVQKARYSAFYGTNFDLVLRAQGIKSLILTGTATSACVESTARDGWFHDYYIVVADDCCAQGNLEKHENALRSIDGPFAVLASAADILREWQGRSEA
jgi:ureidoacrylate peracid hydrolase